MFYLSSQSWNNEKGKLKPHSHQSLNMFKVVFSNKVWNYWNYSSEKLLKPMFVGLKLSALKLQVSDYLKPMGKPAFQFTVSEFSLS